MKVKVWSSSNSYLLLDAEAATIGDALQLIRSMFNRDRNYTGRLFAEVNGKTALYDTWFQSFLYWYGSGWCHLNNPGYYFTH